MSKPDSQKPRLRRLTEKRASELIELLADALHKSASIVKVLRIPAGSGRPLASWHWEAFEAVNSLRLDQAMSIPVACANVWLAKHISRKRNVTEESFYKMYLEYTDEILGEEMLEYLLEGDIHNAVVALRLSSRKFQAQIEAIVSDF